MRAVHKLRSHLDEGHRNWAAICRARVDGMLGSFFWADVTCKRCRKAKPANSFPVTDDLLDAPDGAVVDGFERQGMTWVRQ